MNREEKSTEDSSDDSGSFASSMVTSVMLAVGRLIMGLIFRSRLSESSSPANMSGMVASDVLLNSVAKVSSLVLYVLKTLLSIVAEVFPVHILELLSSPVFHGIEVFLSLILELLPVLVEALEVSTLVVSVPSGSSSVASRVSVVS